MLYPLTVRNHRSLCRVIEEAAKASLRESPYRVFAAVSCECRQGVLLLRGCVSTFYHKQVAQETAARVDGVTQVVNEIEVAAALESGPSRFPGRIPESTQGDFLPQAVGGSHARIDPEADGSHPH